jgi:hypothetical protein
MIQQHGEAAIRVPGDDNAGLLRDNFASQSMHEAVGVISRLGQPLQVEQAKAAWLETAKVEGKPIPPPKYKPAIYRAAS